MQGITPLEFPAVDRPWWQAQPPLAASSASDLCLSRMILGLRDKDSHYDPCLFLSFGYSKAVLWFVYGSISVIFIFIFIFIYDYHLSFIIFHISFLYHCPNIDLDLNIRSMYQYHTAPYTYVVLPIYISLYAQDSKPSTSTGRRDRQTYSTVCRILSWRTCGRSGGTVLFSPKFIIHNAQPCRGNSIKSSNIYICN